jgi:hypothetical protein
MRRVVAWCVLLLSVTLCVCVEGVEGLPSSPHALERDIVTDFPQASACVLLLHTKGVSGCAGQKHGLPLRQFEPNKTEETWERLREPVVLAVEESDVDVFFHKLSEPESKFAQVVKGGFIITTKAKGKRPASFSPASTFPMKHFAPYREKHYPWNPSGLDVLKLNGNTAFPPLFLLSDEEVSKKNRRTNTNAKRKNLEHSLSFLLASFLSLPTILTVDVVDAILRWESNLLFDIVRRPERQDPLEQGEDGLQVSSVRCKAEHGDVGGGVSK